MIKNLLAGTAFVVLPLAASAADLPSRAMAPVLAQAPFSWNGLYVGASIGAVGLSTTVKGYESYAPGRDGYDTKGNGGGALVGASIGYNYQMNNIVYGLEADISGAMASVEKTQRCRVGGCWGTDTYTQTTNSQLNGLATIRARFGTTFDRTLVYATGGVAFGSYKHTAYSDADPSYDNFGSSVRTGWVVGAGVEQALTNSVSLKLEALYADFGTKKHFTTDSTYAQFYEFKDSALIARTGVNFRF